MSSPSQEIAILLHERPDDGRRTEGNDVADAARQLLCCAAWLACVPRSERVLFV
jgi:hypothetical protein